MTFNRICPECGDPFTTTVENRHYCSEDCRQGEPVPPVFDGRSTLIPKGHAERLNWFRQLAHVVHLGRCTRFPFGDCHRHEESEYFTPKDNDIASVVIKWLEFDALVRAEVLARKQEK